MTDINDLIVHEWWITTDFFSAGGQKVLGPFQSKDLAVQVRSYVEKVNDPVTYAVDEIYINAAAQKEIE